MLRRKYLSINFVAIHEFKPVLTLDKSIYIRFIVLHLSKSLMYEFHYKYIRERYGCGTKLSFTDTNSMVYEIETVDVYKDFYEDKSLFSFRDYPKHS